MPPQRVGSPVGCGSRRQVPLRIEWKPSRASRCPRNLARSVGACSRRGWRGRQGGGEFKSGRRGMNAVHPAGLLRIDDGAAHPDRRRQRCVPFPDGATGKHGQPKRRGKT